ncbi:hypothetical protein CC80DRAFT_272149 [Byssothecium circinans]|uniref:Cytochrome c oxidase assembly factor 3 n=1 Tax=Byssothecium circinans TaxID=147558 RepID=A0A6A5TB06_9PLEO|nr:hypothetical protein CC80DRAFT_272149 [Byssothecium circinans]
MVVAEVKVRASRPWHLHGRCAKERPCAEPHRGRSKDDFPATKVGLDVPPAVAMPYKPFRSTYYDERMRAQPALLRARAPYLVKNTITGISICALVIGIYAYTINAISQDEFDDVIVPDEPIRKQTPQPGTAQSVQQAVAARKQ